MGERVEASPSGSIVVPVSAYATPELALAAAEAVSGTLHFDRSVSATSTLVFANAGCSTQPGAILTSSASPAVRIGSATGVCADRTIRLPRITPLVANTGTGVEFSQATGCDVYIPSLLAFADSIVMKGDGAAVAHNTITLGEIYGYTRNIVFSYNGGGWSNQNNFVGGRCAIIQVGSAVAGTRQVQLGVVGDASLPSGNNFFGTSFEGDTPEFHVQCAGANNNFFGCRWETSSGTARFDWTGVALGNGIWGGATYNGVTVTAAAGAQNNLVYDATNARFLNNAAYLNPKPSDSGRFQKKVRLAANVIVNGTNWAAVDSATLDVVLGSVANPVKAGDVIEYSVSGQWLSEAVAAYLDAFTVVGGSPVNSLTEDAALNNAAFGNQAWTGPSGVVATLGGTIQHTLVSGDISAGTVTIRLMARTASATNKTFQCNSAHLPIVCIGRVL